MTSKLSTIEIQPTADHQYSIIWLHGLGADGHDFEDITQELHLNAAPHIRFIFPNAPIQPVTVNGGMEMRAWYDILAMQLEREVDINGIYQSATLIEQLIEREKNNGIAAENILLAGFSQGGVIALHVGLRYPQQLAGIIALSSYLPTLVQLNNEASSANKNTPIFMAHGILDSVVAIESGKAVFDTLHAQNYPIQWHDYVMEHSVCVEEIEHIAAFINGIFK
ncbi:MAG: Carboxylesterase [Methylococcaceae bacterium NSP1-2]|nr:carboxylesterase [Methylococcaceae bacterium]OYV19371.1 MAG: Carboxylesterase [Methylococcaceae bacterium NSP1-2]